MLASSSAQTFPGSRGVGDVAIRWKAVPLKKCFCVGKEGPRAVVKFFEFDHVSGAYARGVAAKLIDAR